ncbi:uncharacterized protein LOC122264192 [Penaeus japonicus]|uniref:uncharacterized protein LOC122264192 n=1 Tax=Penaeus japonicus TaxID=27405 RepID=UPI001C712B55|nr:uncharacterized protein LOC122264192 [Penaeus japonicus]
MDVGASRPVAIYRLTSLREEYITSVSRCSHTVTSPPSSETLCPDGSLRSTRVCGARRQEEGQEAQKWLSSGVPQAALQGPTDQNFCRTCCRPVTTISYEKEHDCRTCS